jgi:hypothetical protein
MTELIEILPPKIEKVNEFIRNLEELIGKKFKELKDDERKSLPKFSMRFDEKSLSEYFGELTKSVKNPIRFRRKRAIEELGICGIENVKEEIFDDDTIEETIQILQSLKSYERLFRILSTKIPTLIVQSSISNANSKLKDFRINIENLRKIEEIGSESVKDYCLRKYINDEFTIYKIDEIKEKVMMIEKTLNLEIRQEEIPLIDDVYTFINSVRAYEKKFEERCLGLNDAKEKLKSYKERLEQTYEQIKSEVDFWRKLCPEIYIPETKNIDTLENNLNELKEKCKEKYKSFAVLEQIYNLKLSGGIEKLGEFAYKLEKTISYFSNLKIKHKDDLNTIERLFESVDWLEEKQYSNIKELCENFTFDNIEKFFKNFDQIKKEHEHLKEDLKAYQHILGFEDEQIDAYPLLRQKIDECKDKLQRMIGVGFESLIRFLKGEMEDIEADDQTLRNFIKTVRPILKETLKI